METMLFLCDNISGEIVKSGVTAMKKHKASIDFDEATYLKLMKIVGNAAHEGIKMPIRAIVIAAIQSLPEPELLVQAKTVLSSEEHAK